MIKGPVSCGGTKQPVELCWNDQAITVDQVLAQPRCVHLLSQLIAAVLPFELLAPNPRSLIECTGALLDNVDVKISLAHPDSTALQDLSGPVRLPPHHAKAPVLQGHYRGHQNTEPMSRLSDRWPF